MKSRVKIRVLLVFLVVLLGGLVFLADWLGGALAEIKLLEDKLNKNRIEVMKVFKSAYEEGVNSALKRCASTDAVALVDDEGNWLPVAKDTER